MSPMLYLAVKLIVLYRDDAVGRSAYFSPLIIDLDPGSCYIFPGAIDLDHCRFYVSPISVDFGFS